MRLHRMLEAIEVVPWCRSWPGFKAMRWAAAGLDRLLRHSSAVPDAVFGYSEAAGDDSGRYLAFVLPRIGPGATRGHPHRRALRRGDGLASAWCTRSPTTSTAPSPLVVEVLSQGGPEAVSGEQLVREQPLGEATAQIAA